jgi:Terminase large subunit, T4likevirus-type, N-terminal
MENDHNENNGVCPITAPGALWDESLNFYRRAGGTPRLVAREWRWPCGGKIKFSHLQFDSTVYDWQGAQIALICFDELTHFTKHQFFYMISVTARPATSGLTSARELQASYPPNRKRGDPRRQRPPNNLEAPGRPTKGRPSRKVLAAAAAEQDWPGNRVSFQLCTTDVISTLQGHRRACRRRNWQNMQIC